jgi:2-phosphoglycerate kinase
MSKIYYIGGSPCSGKSTIAQMIAEQYGLYYFKVDNYLDEYIRRGNASNKPFSSQALKLSTNETWLRDPIVQNTEELEIYREIFEYILEDLSKLEAPNGIITEGAAFLPELIHAIGVGSNSYICIIPTKEFQYHHYKLRPWVPEILKDCTDKKQAFENWMERDALFAVTVKEEADKLGYRSLITDGTIGVDCVYNQVAECLDLGNLPIS